MVLFHSDDQRFDTIRALGNNAIHTPNLDSLARRGMSFRNFYSQGRLISGLCLPSRTMLMTGRPLLRTPGPKDPPGELPLLAKAFQGAGYRTDHNGQEEQYLSSGQRSVREGRVRSDTARSPR